MASVKPAIRIGRTTSNRVKWGTWKDISLQRQLFDQIARELNVNHFEDWYRYRTTEISRAGANTVLADHYERSLCKALQTIYPEYDWKPWKFIRTPHKYWSDHKNVGEYLTWLADQLGITTLDDWYNVSRSQIIHSGGKTLLNKFGGLHNLITTFYPDHNWKQFLFRNSRSSMSKSQLLLYNTLCKLLPNHKILVDYHLGGLTYEDSQTTIELDLYIPSLSLAFEYQGEQHYHFTVTYGDPSKQQQIDAQKMKRCTEAGITLIQVPYWWDGQRATLVGTILKNCPELSSHIPAVEQYTRNLQSIPTEIPQVRCFHSPTANQVESLVQILPSSLQIADVNPHEWWRLECKPGSPCLWDTEKKVLLSQSQSISPLPQQLQQELERLKVSVIGILHDETFQIFDYQDTTNADYEHRYEKLGSWILPLNFNHIQIANKQQYDGLPVGTSLLIHKNSPYSSQARLLFTNDNLLLQAGSVSQYRLAVGPSKGASSKCRGCYRAFRDRNEVRIEIKGTFTPFQHTAPVPVVFRVCLNLQCLIKFQKRLQKKPATRIYLPPFQHCITVPEDLKDRVNLEDLKKQNVQLVIELTSELSKPY